MCFILLFILVTAMILRVRPRNHRFPFVIHWCKYVCGIKLHLLEWLNLSEKVSLGDVLMKYYDLTWRAQSHVLDHCWICWSFTGRNKMIEVLSGVASSLCSPGERPQPPKLKTNEVKNVRRSSMQTLDKMAWLDLLTFSISCANYCRVHPIKTEPSFHESFSWNESLMRVMTRGQHCVEFILFPQRSATAAWSVKSSH